MEAISCGQLLGWPRVLAIDSRVARGIQLSLFAEDWRGRRSSPNSLDSTARSDAEESPGSVLAQATCSFTAGGYPRKTLQVLPRANTAKF